MKKIMAALFVTMCVVFGTIGMGPKEALATEGNPVRIEKHASSEKALVASTEKMKEYFMSLSDWSDGWLQTQYFDYEVVDGNRVHVVIVLWNPIDGLCVAEETADIFEVEEANTDFEEMYAMSFEAWFVSA